MSQRTRDPARSGSDESHPDDFLYHLYRGSELLADGRFDASREELELALRMQPRDASAQDLLARLYFRLGLYPRAIEIYQDIVRQVPDRIPPRINLALALLKTGQLRDTVAQLIPVIEQEPGHQRAWGYLGLAWWRLEEFAKAREAFVRAGHDGMARRMEQELEVRHGLAPAAAPAAPAPAPPAAPAQDPARVSAVAPAALSALAATEALEVPALLEPDEPARLEALAPAVALRAPAQGLEVLAGGALLAGPGAQLARPAAGAAPPAPLLELADDGAPPAPPASRGFYAVSSGFVVLPPSARGLRRVVPLLAAEPMHVAPAALLAVGPGVRLGSEREAAGVSFYPLRGAGVFALEVPGGALHAVRLEPGRTLRVAAACVLAVGAGVSLAVESGTGRVVARGAGAVLLAIGAAAVHDPAHG